MTSRVSDSDTLAASTDLSDEDETDTVLSSAPSVSSDLDSHLKRLSLVEDQLSTAVSASDFRPPEHLMQPTISVMSEDSFAQAVDDTHQRNEVESMKLRYERQILDLRQEKFELEKKNHEWKVLVDCLTLEKSRLRQDLQRITEDRARKQRFLLRKVHKLTEEVARVKVGLNDAQQAKVKAERLMHAAIQNSSESVILSSLMFKSGLDSEPQKLALVKEDVDLHTAKHKKHHPRTVATASH